MIDIHDFVMNLAKPLFIFRMARGRYSMHAVDSQVRSAQTRLENASHDIDELVLAYAEVIKKRREEESKVK